MTRHRHQHPAPFLLRSLLLLVMTLLSATGSAAIDDKAPTVKDIIEEQPGKPDQVTVTKAVRGMNSTGAPLAAAWWPLHRH